MKCPAVLIGLICLTACAGRNAAPVPVMTAYDNDLSCEQIQAEIQSNEAKARQLVDEDNSAHNANIAIGAVGALLFWPALFALDTSDAERVEIQALHDRNMHLASLSRDCSGTSSGGGDITTARAIQHGAYDGKWTAESPEAACGLPWAMQVDVQNGSANGMLWRGKIAYNFAGRLDGDGRLANVLAGKTESSNGLVGLRFINAAFTEDSAQGDYSMPAAGVGTCVVSFNLSRHQA